MFVSIAAELCTITVEATILVLLACDFLLHFLKLKLLVAELV